MNKLFLILVMLAFPLQSASAVITEFDDIALDGQGTNPFIRFDDSGLDKFIVGFTESLGFWGGTGYALRIYDTARNDLFNLRGQNVGIGTTDPDTRLHIRSSTLADAKILLENDQMGSPVVREMVSMVNNGGMFLSMTNTNLNSKWSLVSTGSGGFSVSKSGTGGSEFLVHPNGRVVMGLGGAKRFDLRANGNLFITGTLTQSSDKNLKTAFRTVTESDVLERVAKMPLQTWQFKFDDPKLRHMGPTAQDFRAAFGLGQDDKTIAPVDGIGVSLAAIKALKQESDQKDKTIGSLTVKVDQLSIKVDEQERELAELKEKLKLQQQKADSQTELLLTLAARLDQIENVNSDEDEHVER